jgi:hypothetical protein
MAGEVESAFTVLLEWNPLPLRIVLIGFASSAICPTLEIRRGVEVV